MLEAGRVTVRSHYKKALYKYYLFRRIYQIKINSSVVSALSRKKQKRGILSFSLVTKNRVFSRKSSTFWVVTRGKI